MGICTNKPSQTKSPVLKATGLIEFFDAIVTPDNTKCQKPSEQHMLDTLWAMGSGKEPAFMIGDSENDIQAGHAAGVSTVAVPYGYCEIPFTKLRADACIDRFDALPETLRSLREFNGQK